MMFENIFTQGSLILLLVLTIIYFQNQRFNVRRNKLYKLLLIFAGFIAIAEVAYVVSITFLDSVFLSQICYKGGVALQVFWWALFLIYYCSLTITKDTGSVRQLVKSNKLLLGWFIFTLVTIGIFAFTKYTKMTIYTIDFFHGISGIYITSMAAIAEIIVLVKLLKNKDKVAKMDLAAFFIGMVIVILYIALQFAFRGFSFLPSCYVLIIYVLYFCAENQDIQAINEIKETQKEIEKSNQTKSDFLSNMSYEIKTPMSLIVSLCEELVNMPTFDEATFREDVQQIVMSGNSLLDIVNNILDISKIESGKQELTEKEYKIVDLLTDVVNVTKSKIGSKPVKLAVNVDQNISSVVNGDYSKVYQVLVNILANSAKFTDVGRITFTLSSTKVKNVENLLFKVTDTGTGIKEEDQEKLFEKGTKLGNASDTEVEGSGFGLAITKEYVDTLGGKIWFESKYRVGTTFYVEIPQAIVDETAIGNTVQQQQAEKPESTEKLDCSAFTVLVVDDNLLNIKVAKRLLEGYKLNVESVTAGKDCVYKIKEGVKYDAIFMDHMMPEMDGIETLHVLKKLDGYNLPPIVALTANAVAGMKEMYLSEGFDDYLSKPINAQELDRILNKYFNK